jgi:hypothetical protein
MTPGRTVSRIRARTSWTTCAWRSISGGGSPAATNVRVISVKQPDSSSCGQRSIWIGRAAGNGPVPGSCERPCHADTTISSRDAGASGAQAWRISSRRRSASSGSPSSISRPSVALQRRNSEAAAPTPASAALWARRMPASSASLLTRRRSRTACSSTNSSIPSARSRSATPSGKSKSTIACRTPMRAAAREISSSRTCSLGNPDAVSSLNPKSS